MRSVLISMSLAAFAASATAQCFDLDFGVSLGTGPDVVFPIQPIGFAFPLGGATYTDIHVVDKCFVYLSNGGTPAPGFPDFDATPAELVSGPPRICPLWADIQCNPFTNPNAEVFIKSTPTTLTVTWIDAQCYQQTSGLFNVQMELSISGQIKFLYGPGTTNNSASTQPTWQVGITGVSPGQGVTLPAASDLSVPGASIDNTLFEEFLAPNTFDMADNGLLLIPTNPGWTFIPLGPPAGCASVSTYGAGCVTHIDSIYEEFTTGFDLSNTTITWLRQAGGYTVLNGIPGTFVPPSATAINVAPGLLDGEQVVTLSAPMPIPGGTTGDFNITTKGQVEFANTMNGFVDYTPTAPEMLDWARTAFHCWHDYDQTAAGGGLIYFEEVGGVAYVTWNGVLSFLTPSSNTFQWQFDLATGNVTLVMLVMNGAGTAYPAVVGYSMANPSFDPGATDLSTSFITTLSDTATEGLELAAANAPYLGNPAFTLVTSEVPPLVPLAFTFLGTVAINPGFDLTVIGMPGCSAYTNGDLISLSFPVVGTSGSISFAIPTNPAITGLVLACQSFAFSLDTPLGLVSSNGVAATIGL